MNCPKCNQDTKVIGSCTDGVTVERLRKYLECGFCFTTSENVADGSKYYRLKYQYNKELSTNVY